MNITESKQGSVYTFALAGELDTTTASQLEERLESIDGDVTEIVFDFTEHLLGGTAHASYGK